MPPAVATPNLLTDPGFLWAAPVGTTEPANTVVGGVFTDVVSASYIPLGPTEAGSTFTYGTSVEPMRVAELFDAVKYATVERGGRIAFNLADFTLSNYRRALNGGVAKLAPTSGSGATALTVVEPPEPGEETRTMILWESTDSTVRLLIRQSLQGGEITTAFVKAPAYSTIPCTFNLEIPAVGKPFSIYGAGDERV